MIVKPQARPEPTPIPGLAHSTWVGQDDGLSQISATPPHAHDCDEIVLCQAGRGEVHIDGQVHRFGPDCTIVLRRGPVHQIFNTGDEPMEILGVFGATPVGTLLPDGSALPLPWRS
jgi:mannose-6-phosphate isomerase-like protein (cupin superfamily)